MDWKNRTSESNYSSFSLYSKTWCIYWRAEPKRRVLVTALFFVRLIILKTLIYKKISKNINYKKSLRIWEKKNAVNRFFKDGADNYSCPYWSSGRHAKEKKRSIAFPRKTNRRTDLFLQVTNQKDVLQMKRKTSNIATEPVILEDVAS